MPDAPDGYQYRLESERAVLSDMAELAARLGSPVTWDRRGTVILYDDCKDSLAGWRTITLGAGAAVAIDATVAYRETGSISIIPGSDIWLYSSIDRYINIPRLSRVGIEWTFRVDADCNTLHFFTSLSGPDDGRNWGMEIDIPGRLLNYYDEDGNYTKLDDLPDYTFRVTTWHTIKYVADMRTNFYQRLILDRKSYDLSPYPLYLESPGEMEYLYVGVDNTGAGGNNPVLNVNDFVVTVEEP